MKTQLKTLLLLAIVLCATILYSRHSSEIVFNIRLVKPNFSFSRTTVPLSYSRTVEKKEAPIPYLSKEEEREASLIDTTRQTILFFGDSMLEGLCRRLIDYAVENGHELHTVIWYSSTTQIWAETDTLQYFINKYHPTFLMTCLGGNELSVRDLDRRNSFIKSIIKKMNRYPFVWIGPPNWKEDTGINEMIVTNVGESRYFESKRLKYNRYKDGAHPTRESAAMWMDSIAVYLQNDALVPIEMTPPDKYYKKVPHTTVLQMVKE